MSYWYAASICEKSTDVSLNSFLLNFSKWQPAIFFVVIGFYGYLRVLWPRQNWNAMKDNAAIDDSVIDHYRSKFDWAGGIRDNLICCTTKEIIEIFTAEFQHESFRDRKRLFSILRKFSALQRNYLLSQSREDRATTWCIGSKAGTGDPGIVLPLSLQWKEKWKRKKEKHQKSSQKKRTSPTCSPATPWGPVTPGSPRGPWKRTTQYLLIFAT